MVQVILPGDIDDPLHPSGGNAYDREVCRGLRALGWIVREHPVPGRWPEPGPDGRAQLATILAELPSGTVVLVDGLVASAAPAEMTAAGGRLRLVVLAHMVADDAAALAAEEQALAAARAVIVTSRWTRDQLRDRHDLPDARVHVAEPGVRPADLAAGSTSGGCVVSVGAVTRAKGADVLLEALGRVRDLPWRWTCVGSLDRDPELDADLRRRAAQLGVTDRVTVTGPLPADDVDEVYARSDLLVHPSHAEAYGMVATEALAHGIPVVASDVGGISEALGRTTSGVRPGVLVPPGDAAALADALRRWLEDADHRDRLRTAARERRATLTTWHQTSDRVAQVLTDVADPGADRRLGPQSTTEGFLSVAQERGAVPEVRRRSLEGLRRSLEAEPDNRPRGAWSPDHRWWRWLRPLSGAAIIAVLLARFGAEPFLATLDEILGWPLVIAAAVTVVTTVCCAWRWGVVARGLDVEIRLPDAVAAYYRSQFLNSTLPGGVLGDVHRAVRHGRDVGVLGRGVRSVVWERTLGQVVQVALTVLVLLVLPSPVQSAAVIITVVSGVVMCLALVVRAAPGHLPGSASRVARVLADDLRRVLLTRRAWPRVLLSSVLVVLGHTAVLLVAMRAVGVEASNWQQLSLALVVLLAAALPVSVAGWGPREGAAAWAFGAAGLDAATGVTVAVLYGVLALLATLPGAVVLVADRRGPRPPDAPGAAPPRSTVGARQ